MILDAMVEDSGKYLCMVNNSVGGESVETVLTVTGNCLYICIAFWPIQYCVTNTHLVFTFTFFVYSYVYYVYSNGICRM